MSDTKTAYHEQSINYYRQSENNVLDQDRMARSKKRESRYNEQWKRRRVDLNEICRRFAPRDPHGHKEGYKWVFEDDRRNRVSGYRVVCDMVAGYLRVYKKTPRYPKRGKPIEIDTGRFGSNETTHYKIRKRNGYDTTAGILKHLRGKCGPGRIHRRGSNKNGDNKK